MEDQPLDRRVQRTRQLLRDALFELVLERGYEGIAVGDITERANLGRTTFYLHYRDKEELLKASIKALMQELQHAVAPRAEETCSYLMQSTRIFQHVARQQQLYRALLSESGPAHVGDLIRNYFARLYQQYIFEVLNPAGNAPWSEELVAAHAAGSLFGLISWWLNHESSLSAEEMGEIYCQLLGIAREE
ncbi:TetR/AcrR family transcriptional regulator [Ktedonosporobacter rubrisoli]|uniref:TetR/AcrR family transcriptional regulator n=1 Tax=Ktedonosporobacter rubrisoli TaxID=2509675 RepID=A0A4P6JTN5_KTERU|nr:TetR/AcrR family transcriptional regulator [Ktedonosporobacter rubrisoli]QBD78937.1 TetR/AcrR family transcriptional regulator [Ktedonosporobacter rubrisoli]